jgi:predicted ATPase
MKASYQGQILVREITVRNVLSYGPETAPVPLGPLNVLIGPNGSGKSNLIEALALLRATPNDMQAVIRLGGGVREWLWKGGAGKAVGYLDVVLSYPDGIQPLRHVLKFYEENQRFRLEDERIENAQPNEGYTSPYTYYHYQHGRPFLKVQGEEKGLAKGTFVADLSVLAQRRDPDAYPEISYLTSVYERMRVYREWAFGRNTVFREPQKADMRTDRLEEDFSNLGLFLNRLRRVPKAKEAILTGLRDLYDEFTDFDVSVEGGTVQVFFTEGSFIIPATRLSDGTLRYLCLLAILCDPKPPPLVCIEEPELGLHPDTLPKIADLLIEASSRAQLIVTTHSDILVDALTEQPEAILVCEKHQGSTTMRRLDCESLAHWLETYRLGELWTRGELGGTRW